MTGWVILGIIGALMTFGSGGLLMLVLFGQLLREFREWRDRRRRPGFITPLGHHLPRNTQRWN